MTEINKENNSELILYQTEDGLTKIEVQFDGDTVWLTQNQLADLFQRDKSTISKHIKNIFLEGELQADQTVAFFATVSEASGKLVKRDIAFYNLDVAISVGYRVKSLQGTRFRIWAMELIKEYLRKGFVLNDDRMKNLGGGVYFDELLERIREIRSSEKVFWRKVLDIYATSVDYDPRNDSSVLFFQTVQNKMHWAAHGQTAAEKIYYSADANKPNTGLYSFKGKRPIQSDALIAKNYCTPDELEALNSIVSAYLEFADMQARRHIPMYMADWVETLDGFLKLSRFDILTHAGKIRMEMAQEKAKNEYKQYKIKNSLEQSRVEQDYFRSLEDMRKKLEKERGGDFSSDLESAKPVSNPVSGHKQ